MARTPRYYVHLARLRDAAALLEKAQGELAVVFEQTPVPWVSERVSAMMERISDVETGLSQTIDDLSGTRSNPSRPRRTRRRMGLIRDVRFFREHAGGVVGRATAGALDLARAEREMIRRDWSVLWEYDEDPDLSWMSAEERAEPHEVYCAVLVTPHHGKARTTSDVLASLCGIVDPSPEYRRVVEAELAAEALANA